MVIIRHLRQLVACAGRGPRRGSGQRDAPILTDSAIAADGHRILFVGRDEELPHEIANRSDAEQLDGRGLSAVPGFVDAHTHAVFAGDRRDELRRRLAGASYAEIAATGGGIVATVGATRRASEDELIASTRTRLDEMLACGTTTAEVKSGYGLDVETELKMLKALGRLGASHPVEIVPTFMGAHEIPVDYRSRRDDYVRLVIDRMIPAVASAGLAEWCDVFCETGVFSPDESRAILEAGARHGLKPRIHADELGPSGGSHRRGRRRRAIR